MALTISGNLVGNTFYSCDLNEITIGTDKQSVQVQIKQLSGAVVLSSIYFAVDGSVRIRNLSSFFESVIKENGYSFLQFQLVANDGDQERTVPFSVLYCRDHIVDLPVNDFMNGYFLTTNLNRLTTVHSTEYLSFDMGQAVAYYNVMLNFQMSVRLPDGSIRELTHAANRRVGSGIVTLSFSVSEVLDWAQQEYTECMLLYFSVSYGNRICKYYVQPCPSAQIFLFQNNFGCRETVTFPAVTKSVLETEYSEAMVNGRLAQYDVRHSRSFEVETPPLLNSQQTWLEQFVTSYNVQKEKNGHFLPALIKEYTFEQSDAPNAENTLTFTWQFADARQTTHSLSLHTGIFTEPFNETFA